MLQTEHLQLVLREGENEGTVLQMPAVLLESQLLYQCQEKYLCLETCPLSVVLVMEQAGPEVETGLVADLPLGQELSLAAASLHLPHLLTHNRHLISASLIAMYILPMCRPEACTQNQAIMNEIKYFEVLFRSQCKLRKTMKNLSQHS